MAVVINEFEVVPEAPVPVAAPAPEREAPVPDVAAIDSLVRHVLERTLRVRAD